MAGLNGDQDNGYSSFEDDNDAAPTERTPALVIEAALSRLRVRAGCEEDSFVRRLSTSLLSRMARNIFRRWESTRSAGDVERVPDFLEMVAEELFQFAQRSVIGEEYERRNSRGSLEHDELEEQRRRERGDYRRSPRRRVSHSLSTEDPTLDLDILQPVRVRSSPDDSPMSPMRGLTDPEELRSYQRTERIRVHRRRHSKHISKDSEKEERRRFRRSVDSVESSMSDSLEVSMSATKNAELERSGETMGSDLHQKELYTSLSTAEPVGEHFSSREATVSDNMGKKPKDSSVAQDEANISGALLSSVGHASCENLEMKSLGSSISSLISDSTSDLQGSGASITSEISKSDTAQNSELLSTGSGTSISSEVDKIGMPLKPELSSLDAERNVTPEESSTPSDELLASIENVPKTDAAQETGTEPKLSQKDKARRKKRTRQVIESLSNRQLACLTRLEITPTDVLEMLIQLSVSLDRLDRLINGSRSGGSDIVDENTLAQFFEGLEYFRTREMANRVPLENLDDSQSSVLEITENPRRDPKGDA